MRLGDVVNQSLELNQVLADARNITFEVQPIIPTSLAIKTDPARAVQIITNYLTNALKYSGSGQTVTIGTFVLGSFARVSVIDRGPGVPEDKQSFLFKRFAQVDTGDARKHGGMGLGLAISRELANRMGGRVGLLSEEGKGAEFWVEFPLVDIPPDIRL